MRKILTAALSAMILGAFAGSSFAAFTTVSKSTCTAYVSFAGAGAVNVSLGIFNISNNASVTQLTWTGVTPSVTGWKASDQYILMQSTITDATGGVQLYTNNKGADMTHPYTGVSTATASGLVGWTTTNPALSSTTLPTCWRVSDAALPAAPSIQQGATGYPDRLWDTATGSGYPCYLWTVDAFTGGFTNGMDYITVKDRARGIQHAEATWGQAPSPDYIYFGANFSTAVTPASYETKIRVEAFTE